jgi:uncharacterized protein (TIGR00255 family)
MAVPTSQSLTSMTGFARVQGAWRDLAWHWELKAVNGKALDVRFRLPGGLEHLEAELRTAVTSAFKRGNLQIGLALQGNTSGERLVVNEALLAEITALAKGLRKNLRAPPIQAESLLAMKGVLEVSVATLSEADMAERDRALLKSFKTAVDALNKARGDEGTRLAAVMSRQVSRIAELVQAARDNPSRQPDAVRQKLRESVMRLIEAGTSFDEQRLHQEAMLLATKADIQEELDRLHVHVASARELMTSAEPVGRKFDFLSQEFNREANTLCSKSSDSDLTKIGMELKLVVDQMREQVQNIE